MSLPLTGVRIIAVEQYGAGPFGTQHLADMGAEIIKIENPAEGGDVGRLVGPHYFGPGDSHFFEAFNRNKKSLTLNLKHPESRAVFIDLVKSADATFDNLRGDLATDQQILAGLLHDRHLARVVRRPLRRVDMDAADLSRIFEVSCLVGIGLVQGLAVKQLLDAHLALAAQPGLLGSLALGLLALVRFGLRAQRISPGQIDVQLTLRLRWRRMRLAAGPPGLARCPWRRSLRLAGPFQLGFLDDTALQQLIAQGFGHASVPWSVGVVNPGQ